MKVAGATFLVPGGNPGAPPLKSPGNLSPFVSQHEFSLLVYFTFYQESYRAEVRSYFCRYMKERTQERNLLNVELTAVTRPLQQVMD